jgi:arylformamidase
MPQQRVLFKTRNSTRSWGMSEFDKDFISIRADAAQHLVDEGVMTVGVDYLSIGGYGKDVVETHQIMLGAGIWVIEGLNLADTKPGFYDMICLPLKIEGADGAPCRVVLR